MLKYPSDRSKHATSLPSVSCCARPATCSFIHAPPGTGCNIERRGPKSSATAIEVSSATTKMTVPIVMRPTRARTFAANRGRKR